MWLRQEAAIYRPCNQTSSTAAIAKVLAIYWQANEVMCAPGFAVVEPLVEYTTTVTYEPAEIEPRSILQDPPGLAVQVPTLVPAVPTVVVT